MLATSCTALLHCKPSRPTTRLPYLQQPQERATLDGATLAIVERVQTGTEK